MQKGKIISITECGCRLSDNDLVRVRKKGEPDHRACRVHRGKVIRRERPCDECGMVIAIDDPRAAPARCEACQPKNTKKQSSKRQKIFKQVAQEAALKAFSVDSRGDYCRSLQLCELKGGFDCSTCERFFPIFKGVDPGRRISAQHGC